MATTHITAVEIQAQALQPGNVILADLATVERWTVTAVRATPSHYTAGATRIRVEFTGPLGDGAMTVSPRTLFAVEANVLAHG